MAVRVTTASGFDVIATSTKPGGVLSFENGRIKTDASPLSSELTRKARFCTLSSRRNLHDYKGKRLLSVESGAGLRRQTQNCGEETEMNQRLALMLVVVMLVFSTISALALTKWAN